LSIATAEVRADFGERRSCFQLFRPYDHLTPIPSLQSPLQGLRQVLDYFGDDNGMRRRTVNKRLTKAEGRRMAVNFAGLPEVLRKARPARK
jgi:hypothetical protein